MHCLASPSAICCPSRFNIAPSLDSGKLRKILSQCCIQGRDRLGGELAESYRLKWAGDREQSIGDLICAHVSVESMQTRGECLDFGGAKIAFWEGDDN